MVDWLLRYISCYVVLETWLLTYILSFIPIVPLILMFVWFSAFPHHLPAQVVLAAQTQASSYQTIKQIDLSRKRDNNVNFSKVSHRLLPKNEAYMKVYSYWRMLKWHGEVFSNLSYSGTSLMKK